MLYASHVVVFTSDHLAGTDKEYGDYTFIAKISSHGDHVTVICTGISDTLCRVNMLYALDKVTDLCGLFKFHLRGEPFHLFFKIAHNMPVITVQKADGLLNVLIVIFL